VTSISGGQVVGLITCAMLSYEIRVWDPKTLNLWLIINQLDPIPDTLCTHPNPFVKEKISKAV
jgi:hypothetical protein